MSLSAEEVIACPLRCESHACACGLTLNCRISFIHHVNRLLLYYYNDPDHFLADPVFNVDADPVFHVTHSVVGSMKKFLLFLALFVDFETKPAANG